MMRNLVGNVEDHLRGVGILLDLVVDEELAASGSWGRLICEAGMMAAGPWDMRRQSIFGRSSPI
jgi:hypothetical protein